MNGEAIARGIMLHAEVRRAGQGRGKEKERLRNGR